MQLRSVRVRNIRSYEAAELRLPPGTTLLVGDVGAGKTSLLYAVEMTLFGFAEVDPTYLIRHHAPQAEVALTLAEGNHTYELRRRFRRRMVRGRESFQLESSVYSEDGVTRTYSATELRQRTIDLLGFPDNPSPRAHSDLWRWAVYIPQERMREVLAQNPSERLETVRKALGLEQFRLAAENAQLAAQELTRRSERRSAEAAGLAHYADEVRRWEAEAQRSSEEGQRARQAEADERFALDAADSTVRTLDGEVTRGEAARGEIDELGRREELLTVALERLESRRGEVTRRREELRRALSSRLQLEQELVQAVDSVSRLRTTREALRTEAAQRQGERGALEAARAAARAGEENLTAVDRELHQLTAEETAKAAELDRVQSEGPVREPPAPTPRSPGALGEELERVQAETDRRAGELARAELVGRDIDELLQQGRCPRCHQAVRPQEFEGHRDEAAQAVEAARQALANVVERRRGLEEERRSRERFERAHLSWVHAEERRSVARARFAEARDRRHTLEERRGRLVAERDSARQRARSLEPLAAEYEALVRRAEALDTDIEAAANRRQLLSTRVDRLAQATDELARLEGEEERLRIDRGERETERQELTARRAERDAIVRGLPRITQELEKARAGRRTIAGRLEALHALIGAAARSEAQAAEELRIAREGARRGEELERDAARLRRLAQWLGRSFRDAMVLLEQRLLARAQSEFERTFARYFHSLVDDPSLVARCDSAFSPAVEINGEWTPAEALSGGERTALALAYRLTLGHVVRAFGQLTLETLILDEPTEGFSPEQVVRMGELLDELGLPQVLLVSHEGGLASVADQVVRVRKEGGVSTLRTEGSAPPAAGEHRPAPVEAPRDPPARRRKRVRTLEDGRMEPPVS